jgi:hypothetical protein
MKGEFLNRIGSVRVAMAAVVLVVALAVGCKQQQQAAAPTDQQVTQDVQSKISGEGALAKQSIQVSVASGVVTLSGSVTDDASRALAGNDAGTVAGVKTVVNNLTVQQPQQAAAQVPPPAPAPAKSKPDAAPKEKKKVSRAVEEATSVPPPAPPQQQAASQPPAEPVAVAPPPPPPPPQPVVREITISEGTVLPVRITETLESKTAQANDAFHGSVAGDIAVQGVVAIPRGSAVLGRVVDARDAAHFKGSALLSIELTEVTARGRRISLVTDAFSKEGEGRGKNTAEKAGGGAALGAIIGAIAGGGKGAAIGGVAGAAAGTGVNAATRGQQVTIPTETVVNFRLQSPITVTVTIPPQGGNSTDESDPQLQRR